MTLTEWFYFFIGAFVFTMVLCLLFEKKIPAPPPKKKRRKYHRPTSSTQTTGLPWFNANRRAREKAERDFYYGPDFWEESKKL